MPTIEETIDQMPNANNLKKLAEAADDSSNPEKQLTAVQDARKLLSSDKVPPIKDLVESKMLTILVDCLKQHDHSTIQFEAAWALTNLAYGTSEQTNHVVAAGAVPVLLQLVASPDPKVCEQAVWALGNIVGDGRELRDVVIHQGIVQTLLSIIQSDRTISLLSKVTWVILNLCRRNYPPLADNTIKEIFPILNGLIQQNDTTILADTVLAIEYMTCGSTDQIHIIIESGVVPMLVTLLGHTEISVQGPAMRVIGHILSGSDEQTQVVLNNDALGYFHELMSHINAKIRKEATWSLSNITAGTHSQVQAVIDEGLLPVLVDNLADDDFGVQKETAWAINNLIIKGYSKQVLTLIRLGVIPPICDLLDSQHTEVINVVLNTLYNMLTKSGSHLEEVANLVEEWDGLEKILQLPRDIHRTALNILTEYYPHELEPNNDGNEDVTYI